MKLDMTVKLELPGDILTNCILELKENNEY